MQIRLAVRKMAKVYALYQNAILNPFNKLRDYTLKFRFFVLFNYF